MRLSSFAKAFGILAAFCIAVAVAYLMQSGYWLLLMGTHNGQYTPAQLAVITQQTGEMTRQEFLRRDALETSVEKTGKISDTDLDWVLHLAQTPGIGKTRLTPTRHLSAMLTLKSLHIFAPDQKEKIYAATAPYLASSNSSEKIGAMLAMRVTKDKRAAPAVAKLLADLDPLVKKTAKATLTSLSSPAPR